MLQQKNVVAQEIASLIQDQYATPKCTTEAKRNKVLHVIASFLYKSSEMKQHKAIAPIDRWLLSQSLLNHNLTRKLGVTRKWLYTTTHPPPTQTQCRQYLSYSWPDFNQSLKVGLWDQQQQHELQQQQQQ